MTGSCVPYLRGKSAILNRAAHVQAMACVSVATVVAGCAPTSYRGSRPPYFVREPPLSEGTTRIGVRGRSLVAPELVADSAIDVGGQSIPLGLPQVIRLCVVADPRVRAALESVEQARADHTTAGLLPNPSL